MDSLYGIKGGREEYWLTAYATDFLFRASQQGYSVPADPLKRANDRLLRYLQDKAWLTMNMQLTKMQHDSQQGLMLH